MPSTFDRRMEALALDAQRALLPSMLAAFAVGVAIWTPLALRAPNAAWATLVFVSFALNWAAFYASSDWLNRHPESDTVRTRAHVLAGLLWSASVLAMTCFADDAGPLRESLLSVCVGAAALVVAFASPHLPSLLIVAPAAAAPPLTALFFFGERSALAIPALGAVALALAVGLILNRALRGQFALAIERETLAEARDAALAQAERLAHEKSDLLSTLSREVRTGLAGLERTLAAAGAGRARPSPAVEAASAAAAELARVLDTTLTLEAAQAGRLALAPAEVDPLAIAGEIVSRRSPSGPAPVQVELFAEARGVVTADGARLAQALDALVANAVRYTVRGRVEVRLIPLGEDRLGFEVTDTGPGLAPDELAAAFEPFRRIDRTAAGIAGAGLGLTLARRLVELMGGRLTAESAVGVGSRFAFNLPFRAVADEVQAEPDAPSPSVRVLLLAADPLASATLRSQLEALGHKVLAARDTARAAAMLKRAELDLIVADDDTPLPPSALPHLRIVNEAGAATGDAATLRRPFESDALAKAIERALLADTDRAAA